MQPDHSSAVAPSAVKCLRWSDYLLLSAFCTLLFGYICISGRPMTLHEARLPENSREMMARHDYLIPMNGPRPWLERPPLPHWIMIACAKILGQHADNEWSVRIPPALMGLLIVLLVARISSKWFGRTVGLSTGFMLATMYEFYYYSTLAEDDIFLALVVVGAFAIWIEMEFFRDPLGSDRRLNPIGTRSWLVLAFFILLGLTNLAKGPIVGAAVVIGPLAAYLLWQRDWLRIRRYLWLWGCLLCVAVALSWHILVQIRYPEYWENLRYDFHDTSEFNGPWWYYPPQLLGVIMPWTPAAIAGLIVAIRGLSPSPGTPGEGRGEGDLEVGAALGIQNHPHPNPLPEYRARGPEVLRFLICWAIVPIIVLSIPHRKHHHYLVPSLAPWAILAGLGAKPILQLMFRGKDWSRHPLFGVTIIGLPVAALILIFRHRIPGPLPVTYFLAVFWVACVLMFYWGQWNRDGRWILAAIAICVGVYYNWGQSYWPDDNVTDDIFLHKADAMVPKDEPLIVNGSIGPLDFFRIQFNLRPDAKLIHNLTYLRGTDITSPDVWVISRVKDLATLDQYGQAELECESTKTRRESGPADRFALFHLHYFPDLKRYPPPPVSPMQAMLRKPGPFCGPAPSHSTP